MDNLDTIITDLESNKAENILSMDVSKKTSIASYMIFATGTSNRHVNALSQSVYRNLKNSGFKGATYDLALISLKEPLENVFLFNTSPTPRDS